MRIGWRLSIWLPLAAVLSAVSVSPVPAQTPEADRPPTSFLEDAALHDLCFVNADLGWAVGDRGVIWHTSSGGRAWRMQASPVSSRLDSVCFLDELNGWAAGGFVHPYTHESTGVILRTRDGGKSWQSVEGLALPALSRIRMFDDRRGLVAGYSSGLFPAGVLATQDSGRTWTPLRGPATAGWLAADFRDPRSGVVAGNDGKLALIRGTDLAAPRIADFGPRRLRDIALHGETNGWMVGDGGLILTTPDGGLSWLAPPQAPPVALARQFDFHAVAALGPHVWIAGTPGSTILHSPDGGRTWGPQATGQALPLSALHFVDDQRGWAAGALGTILATTDGGRTWKRQRSGGTRAALLGLFGSLEAVPLEMIAGQAAGDGYLTAIEIVGSPPREGGGRVADAERRGHDAIVALGGSHLSASLRYPLEDAAARLTPPALARRWDRASDGNSRAMIEEQLVRTIRIWRPEVVVTHAPAGADDGLAPLVAEIVLRAAERAADANAYPEQQRLAGLAPWQVRKVMGKLPEGQTGPVTLTSGHFVPRLGRSLGELAASADGLISPVHRPRPASIAFQSLVDRLPAGANRIDLMGGLALSPGGEARRTLDLAAATNLEELRRMAARRRNVQQLIERATGDPSGGAAWLAQTSDLTRDMNEQAAGELLYQLAGHYHASGRLDLAAETHELLVGKYAKHALAESSSLWLLRYYTSAEVAWREHHGRSAISFEINGRPAPPKPPATIAPPSGIPAAANAPPGNSFPPILAQPAGNFVGPQPPAPAGIVPAAPPARGERRERALAHARLLERTRPALYAEHSVKLPVAAALRALGMARDAEKLYASLASSSQHDAWWSCAQAERWIGAASGTSPKPLATCIRATQRPRLDGQLNDPLWRFEKAIELRGASPEEGGPATLLFARDDDFLYVAASCPKSAGCAYQSSAAPRTYDADLAREDRVEILLDVDRDYATFYRLAFDHRGWTGEACFGDRTWNPQWFVAASQTAESWTVEAAIPLAELSAAPPTAKQPWAIGAHRILPGVGLQSWTRPASSEGRPESFGLLVFE